MGLYMPTAQSDSLPCHACQIKHQWYTFGATVKQFEYQLIFVYSKNIF